MKKNSTRAWVVLGIFLIAYQVLAFAIPFHKTPVFWVSYVFTDIALLSQIYVFRSAFTGKETMKSKFYGFPIAQIGVIYATAQIIIGFVFMGLSEHIRTWIPLVIYVLMLGVAAVGMISTEAVRDVVEKQDVKLKMYVTTMRRIQSKTNAIVSQVSDPEAAKAVKKFAEDVRFSDPVSSESIADAEYELEVCVDELSQAVTDGNTADVLSLCKRATALLVERNRVCKLNK